ncbi:hypothetical protein LINGRAHAP2_LOCUS21699 [Linum grandiflorum]
MAAEVSSLMRGLNDRNKVSEQGSAAALITRDLLGGRSNSIGDGSENNPFQELDLDVQVPTGWEKRLDLKSGKVYLHRNSSSSSSNSQQLFPKIEDLDSPKITLNLFDESSLELKLTNAAAAPPPPSTSGPYYQSVCTLDKVKSALERAEKEPPVAALGRKRLPMSRLSSPSYSTSSSDHHGTEEKSSSAAASPVAAGCPGCLSYVLVMKNNPKCPRCNSIVPMPAMKKPRLDLNMSI